MLRLILMKRPTGDLAWSFYYDLCWYIHDLTDVYRNWFEKRWLNSKAPANHARRWK